MHPGSCLYADAWAPLWWSLSVPCDELCRRPAACAHTTVLLGVALGGRSLFKTSSSYWLLAVRAVFSSRIIFTFCTMHEDAAWRTSALTVSHVWCGSAVCPAARELVREVDYTLKTLSKNLLGQDRTEVPSTGE